MVTHDTGSVSGTNDRPRRQEATQASEEIMREQRVWEPQPQERWTPYPVSPLITTGPCVCASDAVGGRKPSPDCWSCKGSRRIQLEAQAILDRHCQRINSVELAKEMAAGYKEAAEVIQKIYDEMQREAQ
jgi:hypothetical protein